MNGWGDVAQAAANTQAHSHTYTHTHIEECTYSDAARLVATYGLCLVVSTKIEAAKSEPEGGKRRREGGA